MNVLYLVCLMQTFHSHRTTETIVFQEFRWQSLCNEVGCPSENKIENSLKTHILFSSQLFKILNKNNTSKVVLVCVIFNYVSIYLIVELIYFGFKLFWTCLSIWNGSWVVFQKKEFIKQQMTYSFIFADVRKLYISSILFMLKKLLSVYDIFLSFLIIKENIKN